MHTTATRAEQIANSDVRREDIVIRSGLVRGFGGPCRDCEKERQAVADGEAGVCPEHWDTFRGIEK